VVGVTLVAMGVEGGWLMLGANLAGAVPIGGDIELALD